MNPIKLLILSVIFIGLISCSSNTQTVKSNSGNSYSCYSDFRNIGKNRLNQSKVFASKSLEIIKNIQMKRSVNFNVAFDILRNFKGNKKTLEIDKKIEKIDEESIKLNKLTKPNSGKEA